MQRFIITIFAFIIFGCAPSQELKPFALTETWLAEIEAIAPSNTTVKVEGKKKILIFSLHTGFEHWTIPHTEAVIKLLAEKTGACQVVTSNEIARFEIDELSKFDAVVLNNNCSIGDRRNLFWDVLKADRSMSDQQRLDKAQSLENNLLKYVDEGGGLIVLHGGIVMQNKSADFGEMMGGSFDYHPKQQNIKVNLVDAKHPMVKAFDGRGFEHIDEPYFFNNAYFDYNFRPLLYMEADQLAGKKEAVNDNIKYISWIKPYGNGRVFYCSPSHNAQSYKNPHLLQFLLDGMQYAMGDLKCDDSPLSQ